MPLRTVCSNGEDLWNCILRSHLAYLNQEESPAKLKQRHSLGNLIFDFLSVVPHRKKFTFPEFENIFNQSFKRNVGLSAYRAALAFEALERYATNLLSYPWRKEYKAIKLYGGFFKHCVQRHLFGSENVFLLLGYAEKSPNVLYLDEPVDPDRVSIVALDCLKAYTECQIMMHIYNQVRNLDCSWLEILTVRQNYVCSVEGTVRILQKLKNTFQDSEDHFFAEQNQKTIDSLLHLDVGYFSPLNQTVLIDDLPTYSSHNKSSVSLMDDPQFLLKNSFLGQKSRNFNSFTEVPQCGSSSRKADIFQDLSLKPNAKNMPDIGEILLQPKCVSYSRNDDMMSNSSNSSSSRPFLHDLKLCQEDSVEQCFIGRGPSQFVNSKFSDQVKIVSALNLPKPSLNSEYTKTCVTKVENKGLNSTTYCPVLHNSDILVPQKCPPVSKGQYLVDIINESQSIAQTAQPCKSHSRHPIHDYPSLLNVSSSPIKLEVLSVPLQSKTNTLDSKLVAHFNKPLSSVRCGDNQVDEISSLSAFSKPMDTSYSLMKEFCFASNDEQFLPKQTELLVDFNSESHSVSKLDRDKMEWLDKEVKSTKSNVSCQQSKWSCSACTFYNNADRSICKMCGRSRHPGAESHPLVSGGKECPKCTLVNQKDSENCSACSTCLKDSPTYI